MTAEVTQQYRYSYTRQQNYVVDILNVVNQVSRAEFYMHVLDLTSACVRCQQIVHGTRPAPPENLKLRVFQNRAAQLIQALVWHPDFRKFLKFNGQTGTKHPQHLTDYNERKAKEYMIECLQYHFPRIRMRAGRESRLLLQAMGTILRGIPGG